MRLKHSSKNINSSTIQSDAKLNSCESPLLKKDRFTLALLAECQEQHNQQIQNLIICRDEFKQSQNLISQNCQSPTISEKQYHVAIDNYRKYITKVKPSTQTSIYQNKNISQGRRKMKTQIRDSVITKNEKIRLNQSIQAIRRCKQRNLTFNENCQFKDSPSAHRTFNKIQSLRNIEKGLQKKQFQLLSIEQYFRQKSNKTQLQNKLGQNNYDCNQKSSYFRPKKSKQAKKWYSNQKKHLNTSQVLTNNKCRITKMINNQINKKQQDKNFFISKSLPNHQIKYDQIQKFIEDQKSNYYQQRMKKFKEPDQEKLKLIQKLKSRKQNKYLNRKQKVQRDLISQNIKSNQKSFENKIFQYPWNWIKYQFSLNIHAKLWK